MTNATFELEERWLVRRTSELPATIAEALEHSIQKWEFIEEVLLDHPWTYPPTNGGSQSCALCGITVGCHLCPVAIAGHEACFHTPYMDYRAARNYTKALSACRAEIAFLKSLRGDA